MVLTPLKRSKPSPSEDTPNKAQLAKRPPTSLHISLEQESIILDDSPPQDKKTFKDEGTGSMSPLPSPDPVLVHRPIPLTPDGMIGAPEDGGEWPPPYEPPKNTIPELSDVQPELCDITSPPHLEDTLLSRTSPGAEPLQTSLTFAQDGVETAEGSVAGHLPSSNLQISMAHESHWPSSISNNENLPEGQERDNEHQNVV